MRRSRGTAATASAINGPTARLNSLRTTSATTRSDLSKHAAGADAREQPSATAVARVEPYSKPWRHPLLFLWQRLLVLVYAGIGVYAGTLIVVAVYYLLFETTATMTHWWHATVPNNSLRHSIRDVAEGLLGALLGLTLAHNHYKKKLQKRIAAKPNAVDKAEMSVGIPNVKDRKPFRPWQLFVTPPLVLLYATPGFLIGYLIATWFHHHHGLLHLHSPFSANPTTADLGAKLKATWTTDWPKKLIGYFAAFVFGRRPARGLIDHLQLFFAERRVRSGKTVRWYDTAPFAARMREVAATASYRAKPSLWLHRLVIGGTAVGFGLACFGWYVLAFIAKRS